MNSNKSLTVAFFNDTGSNRHVGCQAVSNSHNAQLAGLNVLVMFRHFVDEFTHLNKGSFCGSLDRFFASTLVHEMSSVDAVIVNGEGTIHDGFGQHLLIILAGAQRLGKPTYLINSVMQAVSSEYFEVLRKLNSLEVRDQYSYEYLKSNDIDCRLVPDSILRADFREGEEDCFKDKIVVMDCVSIRTDVRNQLNSVLKYYGKDAVYFPLEGDNASDWQDSIRKLSGAKLVVTGRHHGLYLALMAKRPFVALPSNTWKIEGTLAVLAAEEWLWSEKADLIALCEKACTSQSKFSLIYENEFLTNPQGAFTGLMRDFSLASDGRIGEMVIGLPATGLDESVIRYKWACGYIKPGDRILDVHCGLGYGGHIIRKLTHAASVVGVDESDCAINYAIKSFPCSDGRGEYRVANLPDMLTGFADGSFEIIIFFGIMGRGGSRLDILPELYRLLSPGGRVIASVLNNRNKDSQNPTHCFGLDWLESELKEHFLIEDSYVQLIDAQNASDKAGTWQGNARLLKPVDSQEYSLQDIQGWLMTAMKSPLDTNLLYQERVFENISASKHPSIRYADSFQNPWLMHSMVNYGYRLKNPASLEELANKVLNLLPATSNDYAAALCVKAYWLLDQGLVNSPATQEIISRIEQTTTSSNESPMELRWRMSLLFVKGRLLHSIGHLEMAKEVFAACAEIDIRKFGIHLATKATEALYIAGKIAHLQGHINEARLYWQRGIDYGKVLLDVSLEDILINRNFPNLFHHGDGIREYTVAWDNITKCANGVHLLNLGGNLNYYALGNCFQSEYNNVIQDLQALRESLVERTDLLRQASEGINEHTQDLVGVRQVLVDRTQELVDTRQLLVERTKLLEKTDKDLQNCTQELVDIRLILAERTDLLRQASEGINEHTQDLVGLRQVLVDRTQELVDTRQLLVERTELLEKTDKDLQNCTQELVDIRLIHAERIGLSEQGSQSQQLVEGNRILIFLRKIAKAFKSAFKS